MVLNVGLLGSQISPQGDTHTGQRIPAGRMADFVNCREAGRQRICIATQQAVERLMQRRMTGPRARRAQVGNADRVGPLLGMILYHGK